MQNPLMGKTRHAVQAERTHYPIKSMSTVQKAQDGGTLPLSGLRAQVLRQPSMHSGTEYAAFLRCHVSIHSAVPHEMI